MSSHLFVKHVVLLKGPKQNNNDYCIMELWLYPNLPSILQKHADSKNVARFNFCKSRGKSVYQKAFFVNFLHCRWYNCRLNEAARWDFYCLPSGPKLPMCSSPYHLSTFPLSSYNSAMMAYMFNNFSSIPICYYGLFWYEAICTNYKIHKDTCQSRHQACVRPILLFYKTTGFSSTTKWPNLVDEK